jgi:hypothetical protein
MQVICEKSKYCESEDCDHKTTHEHTMSCVMLCLGKVTNCTAYGLRKDKLKKLEELNDNRG